MSSLTASRCWPRRRANVERAAGASMLAAIIMIIGSSAWADQAPANSPAASSPPPVAAPSSAVPPAAGKLPPASSEPTGTPATVIDDNQIESVLGTQVRSPTGEDMGHLVDVLVDKTGQVRAAVIDFGGFFGVGNRKIAVDWRSLHFNKDNKANGIMIDLPRTQLRVSPVYKDGEPVVVLGGIAAPTNAPSASPSPEPVPTPAK